MKHKQNNFNINKKSRAQNPPRGYRILENYEISVFSEHDDDSSDSILLESDIILIFFNSKTKL